MPTFFASGIALAIAVRPLHLAGRPRYCREYGEGEGRAVEQINWLAVILSANLAMAIGFVWYGPLFGGARLFERVAERAGRSEGPVRSMLGAILLQGLSALLLGHMYARIGTATLDAKPWLYWMQSGGIALGFIVPALWISYSRQRLPLREALVDSGFWLTVYLAAGTVFWALS